MKAFVLCRPLSLRGTGLFLFYLGVASSVSINAKAANEAIIVNFSASFVAPTCVMSVPSIINFSSNGRGIQSSELVGDGITYPGGVTLSFSECKNQSFTVPLPRILVKGRAVQLGGSELYFADQPNPSGEYKANGYGLKLSVSGQTLFEDNANIAETGGPQGGGVIKAKSGKTFASINGTSLNLIAQLSCGSYSPCSSAPGHELGPFKATVTFQLAYD